MEAPTLMLALVARAKYPPDVTGDLMWELDMQQYTDGNFNPHGV